MEFIELDQLEGIELLQKLPIFSLLTYDETTRLGDIACHRTMEDGGVVIERDALGEALYVVLEGQVLVTAGGKGPGSDEELGRLGVGELFGEMSLVDDLLTSARVTALGPCKLLELPRKQFQALIDADHQLAVKIYRSFCRTLSARLRSVNDHLSADQAFSVGVR